MACPRPDWHWSCDKLCYLARPNHDATLKSWNIGLVPCKQHKQNEKEVIARKIWVLLSKEKTMGIGQVEVLPGPSSSTIVHPRAKAKSPDLWDTVFSSIKRDFGLFRAGHLTF